MSPEQAHGDVSAINVRTDVFGLGTILYAILCNRAAFHSDSVAESVHKVSKVHYGCGTFCEGHGEACRRVICRDRVDREPRSD